MVLFISVIPPGVSPQNQKTDKNKTKKQNKTKKPFTPFFLIYKGPFGGQLVPV